MRPTVILGSTIILALVLAAGGSASADIIKFRKKSGVAVVSVDIETKDKGDGKREKKTHKTKNVSPGKSKVEKNSPDIVDDSDKDYQMVELESTAPEDCLVDLTVTTADNAQQILPNIDICGLDMLIIEEPVPEPVIPAPPVVE
jgi:hypothetical protein